MKLLFADDETITSFGFGANDFPIATTTPRVEVTVNETVTERIKTYPMFQRLERSGNAKIDEDYESYDSDYYPNPDYDEYEHVNLLRDETEQVEPRGE